MKIEVLGFHDTGDESLGLLKIDGVFMGYTLEDEKREVKVMHETRIPRGRYKIGLRTTGGFHNRYLSKFGASFHKGMLQILDVPGFEYILIHCGNTDEDTSGCVLVGSTIGADNKSIGSSVKKYKEIYPIVLGAIERGEEVYIELRDI